MITATNPEAAVDLGDDAKCTSCRGAKGAPLAAIVDIGEGKHAKRILLCQECGRDASSAIERTLLTSAITCGWSKLEPRRRKAKD